MKYLHVKKNLALFMTAVITVTGTPVLAGAQEYEEKAVLEEAADSSELSEENADFQEEPEEMYAQDEKTDDGDELETEDVDTLEEEPDTGEIEETPEISEEDFDSGEEDAQAASDLENALQNIKEISTDTEIVVPASSDSFFAFTPSQSGFYEVEESLGVYGPYIVDGNNVHKTLGSLGQYQPYLKKDQRYILKVSSSSFGNGGTFQIHFTGNGNYDAYQYAGRTDEATWTFDGSRLTFSTKGRISHSGPFSGSYCLGENAVVKELVITEGATEIPDECIYFSRQYFAELEKVQLPASLTVIGEKVFKDYAKLKTVTVPANSSLTNVKEGAFVNTPYYNSLTGEYSMLGNVVLKYQGKSAASTIPANTKSIGAKSMSSCKTLKSITVPGTVEYIGYAAFQSDTSLEKVVLNEGLKTIDGAAFMGCDSLHEITIPKSVTLIQAYAIGYSRYNSVESDEKDPYEIGQKYDREDQIVINCWYNSTGYSYAISDGFPYKLMDKKDLGDSKISNTYFTQQKTAKQTKVTANVSFAGNKLKEGRDYTCKAEYLSNGKIRVTVTGKGEYFGTYRETITDEYYQVKKAVPLAKGKTFTAGTSRYKVTGTRAVTYLGTTNKKATKISIGNTITYKQVTYKITSVYTKALRKNTKVSQVSIGNNVATIGTSAFEGCTALKSVTIGTGVVSIGKDAFRNCKKNSAITIKSTKLKTVGSNAFRGIYGKAKIKVPSSKLKAYQKILKNKGQGSKVKISR